MLVSIVIPCYNVEAFIAECLDSALAQTHPHTEIICVDDGSTDGTLRILQDYQARYPDQIKVIDGPHQGAPAARNTGLQQSKGEYIEFLDADDLLYPEKIASNLNIMGEKRPGFVVGALIRKKPEGIEIQVEIPVQNPWLALIKGQLGCTPSNLWQKAALNDIGGWNLAQKSSQEVDLMFRLLQNGATPLIDNTLLTYVRMREQGSISYSNLTAVWLRAVEVRERIRTHLQSSGQFSPEIEAELNSIIFGYLRLIWPERPREAEHKFHSLLPKGYAPAVSALNSPTYLRLYKILGFSFTERLLSWKRKLLG